MITRILTLLIILLGSALLSLLLPLSFLDFSTDGQEQFITYQDPKGMFTIQYPGNWEKKENQSGGVSFFVPETSAVFEIYVQSLGQLKELYHRDFDSLEQFADRHILYLQHPQFGKREISGGVNSTTIGENRALRTESNRGALSPSFDKMLHIWTLAGNDAYTFTFTARPAIYQEYLPTIEKMIDSFRFLNVSSVPGTIQVTEPELNKTAPSSPVEETSPQQTVELMETYTHPQGTYSIQYPSGWEVLPATNRFENIEVELSKPNLGPGQMVTVDLRVLEDVGRELDIAGDLEAFIDLSVIRGSVTNQVPGFSVEEGIECGKYTIQGAEETCSVLYSRIDPTLGSRFATLQVSGLSGDNVYVVSYTASPNEFDKDLAEGERIINSFRITEDGQGEEGEEENESVGDTANIFN